MSCGFTRNLRDALPKASFIGFTGTPIESGDKNTQAVFGDYIDVYDILQSKEDKATVPIYYAARRAKIDLKPSGWGEHPVHRFSPAMPLQFKKLRLSLRQPVLPDDDLATADGATISPQPVAKPN